MPGKFFCSFHIPDQDLPYSIKRLKKLLDIYIDTVNGERSGDPANMVEFQAAVRKLTSNELASPMITFTTKKIKGIDGEDKEILEIWVTGRNIIPLAILDYQD